MANLIAVVNFILAAGGVLLFAGSIVFLITLSMRGDFSESVKHFVRKHGILLGALVGFGAVLSSLFYSEIAGYTPCVLCWWQRIFIYPLAVMFMYALPGRHESIYTYARPLAWLGLLFSIYQNYLTWGGSSLGVCDKEGLCTRLYVNEWGFMTIPLMAFAALLFLLTLSYVARARTKK